MFAHEIFMARITVINVIIMRIIEIIIKNNKMQFCRKKKMCFLIINKVRIFFSKVNKIQIKNLNMFGNLTTIFIEIYIFIIFWTIVINEIILF